MFGNINLREINGTARELLMANGAQLGGLVDYWLSSAGNVVLGRAVAGLTNHCLVVGVNPGVIFGLVTALAGCRFSKTGRLGGPVLGGVPAAVKTVRLNALYGWDEPRQYQGNSEEGYQYR